jgi:hypothetical protein
VPSLDLPDPITVPVYFVDEEHLATCPECNDPLDADNYCARCNLLLIVLDPVHPDDWPPMEDEWPIEDNWGRA